ncbi:MAG: hybrid sensor histidine kinase/response regulator [Burkholderiales bacterium]|nr:MAG: hybrid sensor histidine kinase/response regulator [Burkholderiales bacterium]
MMLLAAASTATAEAAEEERRARLEAEAANASKDQFLAIVSHELRTPLHAILGWLNVIERSSDAGPSLQRALGVIRRNAESQSHLIDDLLDLARIEQGKLQIDRKPVDLGMIVGSVCESQGHVATERRVNVDCPVVSGALVLGDPLRLQQVVANLLSNALKFTPAEGQITIRLRRDGDVHVLDVADNGKGIAPEMLGRVFERFSQDDTSSQSRYAGLGLGLALVRHIVELHGGQVSASSEGEGRGATFTVRLPALDAAGAVHAKVEPAAVAQPGSQHANAVMVVDEPADARDAVARWLDDAGYGVLAFGTADAALQWLAAHARPKWPVAVLCDIEMSARDGYAFLDELHDLESRHMAVEPALPVVALTANAGLEEEARALAHGFDGYVPKPARPERVLPLLRDLIRCRVA